MWNGLPLSRAIRNTLPLRISAPPLGSVKSKWTESSVNGFEKGEPKSKGKMAMPMLPSELKMAGCDRDPQDEAGAKNKAGEGSVGVQFELHLGAGYALRHDDAVAKNQINRKRLPVALHAIERGE